MSVVRRQLLLNGITVEMRLSDRFINAAQLAKASGKNFNDWKRKASSREAIEKVEKLLKKTDPKIVLIDTIKTGPNLERGTWIHSKLAVPYIKWCLPNQLKDIIKWVTGDTIEETKLDKLPSNDASDCIFDAINQAFIFESKQVRTFINGEDIWFCGRDVAEILGYKDEVNALRNHVDDEDKKYLKDILEEFMSQQRVGETPPRQNYTNNELNAYFINESGLYSLILRSNLPIAKQFKLKVTRVILPSIRKLGQEKYLKQLAQLQLEQEKQQLLLKQKEEELFAKNQLITTQMDDNFWIMATNKNNLTLKKYGKLVELFYLGGIKHKARQDTYNNKAGISIRGEIRDAELSTGSSPNSPFESEKFTLPEGSEQMFETYIHSLLDPFNIKKSRTQKDRKKGAKEHFMIPNAWMLYFIQKARENHISLIEEVNELIDLVEKNNMNFDKVNVCISDMFEEEETDEEKVLECTERTKYKTCFVCHSVKKLSEYTLYETYCDECATNHREQYKNEVMDKLNKENELFSLDIDDLHKLEYIQEHIEYISYDDILGEQKITIGDYRRCHSDLHEYEIDRWLLNATEFVNCAGWFLSKNSQNKNNRYFFLFSM